MRGVGNVTRKARRSRKWASCEKLAMRGVSFMSHRSHGSHRSSLYHAGCYWLSHTEPLEQWEQSHVYMNYAESWQRKTKSTHGKHRNGRYAWLTESKLRVNWPVNYHLMDDCLKWWENPYKRACRYFSINFKPLFIFRVNKVVLF